MNHDQNFKNLVLDYPREALAFFAASESEHIDASARIVPIRQEQLRERLGERFRELDVPLLVEWPDRRREVILFVLEEETDPRRFSIHRMAHYCLDLAEMFDTRRVVPVVIYLNPGTCPTNLVLGGDRHSYLEFRYLCCALSTIPYESYRDSDNLVARLNLPNMSYAPEDRVDVYAGAVRGLFSLESHPERQAKYLDFIDIYTRLDDNERRRYELEYRVEAEAMSTFAERFRQEGIEQGMQQGMQQGLQQGMKQGEARVLIRLMTRKFGEIPKSIRMQIESADPELLLEWSERVLTADSIDEVLH